MYLFSQPGRCAATSELPKLTILHRNTKDHQFKHSTSDPPLSPDSDRDRVLVDSVTAIRKKRDLKQIL